MGLVACLLVAPTANAELRGHGGPVKAVAITADGRRAVTGGFDAAVILWSLDNDSALRVLRRHTGGVSAVIALDGERYASGGEDGRIFVWRAGSDLPVAEIAAHDAPVAALAWDGTRLASAGWDGLVRIHDQRGGPALTLAGHAGPVNGVALARDGRVISAGYDGTLRAWTAHGDGAGSHTLPTPLNTLAMADDGTLAVGGGDGIVYRFSPALTPLAASPPLGGPLSALAWQAGTGRLAAAALPGRLVLLEADGTPRPALVGGGPIWSLAFTADGRHVLTAGGDGLVRRRDAGSGAILAPASQPAAADPVLSDPSPGARLFRACAACHTLTPDGGGRAGPSLHGLIGRKIASAPGYAYSDALKRMDIIWTRDTVARLMELGPAAYTPGSRMPEQRLGDPADRAALADFLAGIGGTRP